MSSLIPWVGARGTWDPFDDLWDPFDGGGGRNGWLWNTSGQRGRDDVTAIAQARVDWRETDNAHIITAEIPGVRKEEVKVEVEDGTILKISGERKREAEEKADTWHRVERRWGSFVRRFRLPENAKMDEVKCTLENGVLNVTIPKKETTPAGSNVRAIDIS